MGRREMSPESSREMENCNVRLRTEVVLVPAQRIPDPRENKDAIENGRRVVPCELVDRQGFRHGEDNEREADPAAHNDWIDC